MFVHWVRTSLITACLHEHMCVRAANTTRARAWPRGVRSSSCDTLARLKAQSSEAVVVAVMPLALQAAQLPRVPRESTARMATHNAKAAGAEQPVSSLFLVLFSRSPSNTRNHDTLERAKTPRPPMLLAETQRVANHACPGLEPSSAHCESENDRAAGSMHGSIRRLDEVCVCSHAKSNLFGMFMARYPGVWS